MLDMMLYYNIDLIGLICLGFFCETFLILDHSEVHPKKKSAQFFY